MTKPTILTTPSADARPMMAPLFEVFIVETADVAATVVYVVVVALVMIDEAEGAAWILPDSSR